MNDKKKAVNRAGSTASKKLRVKVPRPHPESEGHRMRLSGERREGGKISRSRGKATLPAGPAAQRAGEKSNPTHVEYFKDIVATIREPLAVLDAELRVLSANKSFYKFFKVTQKETVGRRLFELGDRQWDIPALRNLLETILPQKAVFNDYEVTHDFPAIGKRSLLLNARRIPAPPNEAQMILLAFEDTTERRRLEKSLQTSEERFRRAFETAHDGMLLVEKTGGQIVNSNQSAEELLGYSRQNLQKKKLWDLGIMKDEGQFRQTSLKLEEQGMVGLADMRIPTKQGGNFPADVYLMDKAAVIQCNIRDIRERKQREKESDEELILLRTLIDNLPDRIYAKDVQGRKTLSSTADWRASGGKTMKDILGKTDLETYPPEIAKEYWAVDKAVIDSGISVINREEPGLDAQGNPVWVLSSKIPLLDRQGKVTGLVGIGRDITEHKRAEEALRESEDKFKYVFEYSNVGKSITQVSGEISVNRTFCAMLDYSSRELETKKWQEITHPDDIALTQREIDRMLSGEKEAVRFNKRYLKKDGSVIWVDLSSSLRRDKQGQPLYFMTSLIDITESKQNENNMRASEAKFSKLFHSSPDAILLTELNSGRIVEVNNGFEKLSGYYRDELIGHSVLDLNMYGAAERQRFVSMVKDHSSIRNAEFTFRNKAGETLSVLASAELIDINNETHALTILHDITERKQAQALQEAVYRIATAAETTPSLDELYPQIHQIVSSVMPAENFYIAIYDKDQDLLRFPYIKDAEDEPFIGTIHPEKGVTAYVLRTGKSLLGTQAAHEELERRGDVILLGEPSAIWLGVPLIVEGKTIGVMAVQHYSDPNAYGEREQHMLEFVSTQIANAIHRKQAEEALRASELMLKRSQAIAHIGSWELDIAADRLTWSDEVYRMFGVCPQEFGATNEAFLEFVHPDDRARVEAAYTESLRNGSEVYEVDHRIVRRDSGEVRYVHEKCENNKDASGRISLSVGMVQDVTERKKAEEALQESEERYRGLVDQSLMGIGLSIGNRVVFANPALLHIFGYDGLEEFAEIPLLDHVAPASHDKINVLLKQVAQGITERVDFEYDILRKDGKIRTLYASATHIVIGGEIYSQTAFQDITERKQAERLLRESKAQLQMITDNMQDMVIRTDLEGLILYASSSHESVLGVKPEKLVGKSMYAFMHPDDIDRVRKFVLASLQNKTPGKQEFRYQHTNGHYLWLESNGAIIFGEIGLPVGAVFSSRDVTERKQAEEKVKAYSDHLEEMVAERTRELGEAQEKLVRQEKLAVLGQLAGSVGHELRNPLGVINTSIYFLKLAQPEASEKIKEHYAMVEQEVHNADKIISDLLDFGRVISSDRQSVSVPELVRDVLSRFPVPPPVQVTTKIPADLPRVYADPRQVEQVLGNLTTNAYQAMFSRTGVLTPTSTLDVAERGKLTISARAEKGMVAIAVKDTGTGIFPENMQKLFEPLFTTKVKGIGLGLAVSKKLAEANGGRIEVDSEVGKGSTFTLVLPVKRTEDGGSKTEDGR